MDDLKKQRIFYPDSPGQAFARDITFSLIQAQYRAHKTSGIVLE